jgi:uncharacterized protein YdeI (YjbR/CyaY-like superfamily)
MACHTGFGRWKKRLFKLGQCFKLALMEKKNPAVDAYIEQAAPFAKPILNHLRRLVHAANPAITETIKWGFPHFEYKGLVCHMAAFKQHCSFGFWKASLLSDSQGMLAQIGKTAMGHLGQIKSLADLPPDTILTDYIREAVRLNEADKKAPPATSPGEAKELQVPDFFLEALRQHPAAQHTFQNFSKSNRKEYVEWLLDAKTEETRNKRLATAMDWLAAGKTRNWKYSRK